jgi:4-carboxymuconolactone decarboxylase
VSDDDFFGRLRISRPEEMGADELANREMLITGPRGGVTGPYKIWARNGSLAKAFVELDTHLNSTSRLSSADREMAILVCAEQWDAAFVARAHAPRAVDSGVPAQVVTAVLAGQLPAFADPRQKLIYDLTRELYKGGRLSDEMFERGLEALGQDGFSDLLALLGYYTAVALTLNAYAVPG